ncbi:Ig-like domain-containing protein, partial [Methanobacterium petrolearium]
EYQIVDADGDISTATVTLTVNGVDDVPVAVDDHASTPENTPVTINVLDNDTDIEHDTLTVIAVTQPSDCTAVINQDGTVTYTPDDGYYGPDSFTYTISDGNGGTSTATVYITVTQQIADLSVTKEADKTNASIGDMVHFTIVVQNHGPDTALNTKVTEYMPSGLQFVSYVASVGTYNSETGIWTIGDLPSGTVATLTITSTVKGSGSLLNRVSVTSLGYDPILDGNEANCTIEVSKPLTQANAVSNVNATTIPMQNTGIPLLGMVLAVLMVLGGIIAGKKK